MRIYQWEEVAHRQADVERKLIHRELVRAALEANPQRGAAHFFTRLAGTIQDVVTGLFAYGSESAKNCCTAEKRASAASF